MLGELSSGFSLYDIALATADQACARDAIARVSAARDSMVALDSSIGWARRAARWSLRGRLAAAEIGALVARYDRRASTLYAATLLFGEALADALQQAGPPPHWLRERVHRAAESYRAVAAAPLMQRQMPPLPPVGPAAPDWQACVVTLLAAERALRAFAAVPTPPEPSA
jgi:hypothetical protein